MKKITSSRFFFYGIGMIVFFLLWAIISVIVGEPKMVFPTPWATFAYAFNLFKSAYIYKAILHSFLKMLLGFTMAFILGGILGTIAGNNKRFAQILRPTVTILKAIPTAAIVYLFLVMVGAKFAPVMLVFLLAFPILYESFVAGITNIDPNIIDAMKVDSKNVFKNTFKVKLPLAIPYVLVGIASSFALSFKIEIMSEIIAGNTSVGIGSTIQAFRTYDPSNMVPVFAYCLIAVFFILFINAIKELIKKRLEKRFPELLKK